MIATLRKQWGTATCVALAAYFVAWSLLPALLGNSLPLDVVEGIHWGREWQAGYYKHPPLPSWLLYPAYAALGWVGPMLLSQLCIMLALFFVYRLGSRLLSPEHAAIGTLLVMGIYYYSWPSVEFNHNIAQLPIWAALGYYGFLCLQEPRLRHWLLLGLWCGLGMLTKYSVAIMILVLLGYMVISPYRRLWRTLGPWLTIAVSLLVFVPNGLWLVQHDWLPLHYAAERSATSQRTAALELVITQVLMHLPLLLIVLVSRPWKLSPSSEPRTWRLLTPHASYLWTIALAPFLLVVAMSVVTGKDMRQMWASPMWNFSGLLAVALLPANWLPTHERLAKRGIAIWLLLVTMLMVVFVQWGLQLRGKPSRMHWPAKTIATQVQSTWQTLSSCPLQVISGDSWLAGLAAMPVTAQAPHLLIDNTPNYAPWVTPALLQQGTLWIWNANEPQPATPEALRQIDNPAIFSIHEGVWTFSWGPSKRTLEPLRIGWRAYVPSQACIPHFSTSKP